MINGKLPHILLKKSPEVSSYTTPPGFPFQKPFIAREREKHGNLLIQQFEDAWKDSVKDRAKSIRSRNGTYIEFISDPGAELITKSLEDMRSKQIRLLNIRTEVDTTTESNQEITRTLATVYVANKKSGYFVKKLEEYIEQNTSSGKPKNSTLVNSISEIRKALLVESFWVNTEEKMPSDEPEWIEVWLRTEADQILDDFEALLNELEIAQTEGVIKFPERSVKVIYANRSHLESISLNFDFIAEYRKAKDTTSFFMDLTNIEQVDWSNDLLERSSINIESQASICILDTGINWNHPLLAPIITESDCQAVDSSWGITDHHKHGTLMAGTALYGNLTNVLSSSEEVSISHKVESVKILPPPPLKNKEHLWGYITSQAVSLAEINNPDLNRSYCMAVTAIETMDRGRPSSWSAKIDQLSSGYDDSTNRLFILSAGNVSCEINDAANGYPDIQLTSSIQDPAHSWNAITVGAYTELDDVVDPSLSDFNPVANKGELSPFSTTSLTWEKNKWPIKPEVILEGGNLALDNTGFSDDTDDLKILSTFYKPQELLFYPYNMTSAATAQLAQISGTIQSTYSEYWPETIRALIVHSAIWPDAIKNQFMETELKNEYKRLLSICGYGVPDLTRALYCTQSSLTIVSQSIIQPYEKKVGGRCKTKDMHLYELPWPTEVLLELPDDVEVEMKITLSYFIEPGPGEVGWKDRYRYPSHGLRFNLNSPGEQKDEFIRRINHAARDDDNCHSGTDSSSSHWLLGRTLRNRGSVHSDTWKGTPAELALCNYISISPTIGWWKEREYLGRCNSESRYSLIVSITSSDESIDIYTPVFGMVDVPVEIEIEV